MIIEEKAILRKKYKNIRAGLGEIKSEYSRLICDNCEDLSEFQKAECVLLYCAKGSEANILPLAEASLCRGKAVAFPRCIDRENMVFQCVGSLSELKEGYFGIKEPPQDAPLCDWKVMRAICFVPALAFDREGYRLGYGGGYYDRFLSEFEGTSVGIAFEACIADKLPRDRYDMKTNYIITESQVKKTRES